MNEIILEIKKAIINQGISETKAARLANVEQSKVNRLLSGHTKKIDMEVVSKLQTALGIVAEEGLKYGVKGIHQQVTQEENELLQYFRQLCPEQRFSSLQMIRGLLLLSQKSEKSEVSDKNSKVLKSA